MRIGAKQSWRFEMSSLEARHIFKSPSDRTKQKSLRHEPLPRLESALGGQATSHWHGLEFGYQGAGRRPIR